MKKIIEFWKERRLRRLFNQHHKLASKLAYYRCVIRNYNGEETLCAGDVVMANEMQRRIDIIQAKKLRILLKQATPSELNNN